MKVIVTGSSGQLGGTLVANAPPSHEVVSLSRTQLDIGDSEAVTMCMNERRPDLVINAAAYTAVDRAEVEPKAADRVNTDGPRNLANALVPIGGRLIHVSTDYVFDGMQGRPYRPGDRTNPINHYGRSKLNGEIHVQRILQERALIIRTAWLYSVRGSNFVHSIIRAMRERDEVRVVCDQIGSPTWAQNLAELIWTAADRPELRGIYHWTSAGVGSWYDFAVAIQDQAFLMGLLTRKVPVIPIATDAYPTPARRPAFSVLDKEATCRDFSVSPEHWQASLAGMLAEFCNRN